MTEEYRYFPDLDLAALDISDAWLDSVCAQVPELPQEKSRSFIDTSGLPVYDAIFLNKSRLVADYFEKTVILGAPPKLVSNWIMGDIMRHLDDVRGIE